LSKILNTVMKVLSGLKDRFTGVPADPWPFVDWLDTRFKSDKFRLLSAIPRVNFQRVVDRRTIMLLVMNVNNTNTSFGLYREDRWIAHWRVATVGQAGDGTPCCCAASGSLAVGPR
jgi:hypothetical protein